MWQGRGICARLLYPLSALHGLARAVAVGAYRIGLKRAQRVGLPVVVIGNLYAGGTGKTPLLIEVVRSLRQRGWHPGVVSRGYGGSATQACLVSAASSASECGDEPLLIASATGAPVAIGRDRVAAARLLHNTHPSCDVLITDDGLQHRRLARDVEIAVIHPRGLGNGWLLPAGPLRDPPRRLRQVDAVVFNGRVQPVRIFSPFFRMHTSIVEAYSLARPERRVMLADLAHSQTRAPLHVLAACGIGTPEQFFLMLKELGLRFDPLALPDHFAFRGNPFPLAGYERILITEKDAVKCRVDRALAHDERLWVVPLRASLDPQLTDLIESRLQGASHGSAPA